MNRHYRRVMTLAARYGCRLIRYGRCWRVVGDDVDVLVADLWCITEGDIAPRWRDR